MLKKLLAVCLLALFLVGCSKPPTKAQVQESIKQLVPVAFEVVDITELKQVPGLYQVVIRVHKQPVVLYLDKSAKYAFSGIILSLPDKTNMTQEVQKKYLEK